MKFTIVKFLQNKNIEEPIHINIKNVIGFLVLFLTHVFLQQNSTTAIVLSLTELAVITCFVLIKKIEKAYLLLLLVLAASLEMGVFVFGDTGKPVYSIYGIPGIGASFFYLLTYILCCYTYQKWRYRFARNINEHPALKHFIKCLCWLLITGIFSMLITYLVNDNGIQNLSWYPASMILITLRILSLYALLFNGIILVVSDKKYYDFLSKLFTEILIAGAIASVITVVLGLHGYYGPITTILLMPLMVSLCPVLIVCALYVKIRYRFLCILLGVVFVMISFTHSSLMGAKFFIIPFFCLFLYVINSFKKQVAFGIVSGFFFLLAILVGLPSLLAYIEGNEFINWKLLQLFNMLNFASSDAFSWYLDLGNSSRFRVDEFVNIFLEYYAKPYYLPFGKGNTGTVTQWWGITNWNVYTGASFTMDQVFSGVYMSMHESLNLLFLRHGLTGLYFFFITMVSLIKRINTSPWALPGIIWLFFYWGIYYSWLPAAIMLVIALADYPKLNNKKQLLLK